MTALSGPLPAAFDEAELRHIFSGGVLMDAPALETLLEMGLGTWAGVEIAGRHERDVSEVLSQHPLNGRFHGWSRDGRQSFWPQTAYSLAGRAAGVEPLSHLVDYSLQSLGVGMTAFENELGGRVVVMGYYPWSLMHNLARSSQLKAVCRWLSRDRLPAMVETYARVVVWAWRSAAGDLRLVVLNASLDSAARLELRVHSRAARVHARALQGPDPQVTSRPDGPEHRQVTVEQVAPWSLYLLYC